MTGQFEIRPSTAVDAPALSLLGQATFLEAFAGILDGPDILAHCAHAHAADLYASWLADERYRIWMARAQPGLAPVGRFQGSGLGRRLMAIAIEQARARGLPRLLLGVYSENAAAIRFYRRLGFETIGHRSFTVGATVCDDLVMSLVL